MPTTKHRINITLPNDIDKLIIGLAKRDKQSVSDKAVNLLMAALETEEDIALNKIVNERMSKKVKWISHEDAWK